MNRNDFADILQSIEIQEGTSLDIIKENRKGK